MLTEATNYQKEHISLSSSNFINRSGLIKVIKKLVPLLTHIFQNVFFSKAKKQGEGLCYIYFSCTWSRNKQSILHILFLCLRRGGKKRKRRGREEKINRGIIKKIFEKIQEKIV